MSQPLVLLVDDEPGILSAMKRTLRGVACEIETETEARTALRRVVALRPVVIVSDFRMPEMSGMEFLSLARELLPDVAVALHTADPGLVPGDCAWPVFEKPIAPDVLIAFVERCLAVKQPGRRG